MNINNNNIVKIGTALKWRNTFDLTTKYYQENVVTACGCVFRCKVLQTLGQPPIKMDDDQGHITYTNTDVWEVLVDMAYYYNYAVDTRTLTKQMLDYVTELDRAFQEQQKEIKTLQQDNQDQWKCIDNIEEVNIKQQRELATFINTISCFNEGIWINTLFWNNETLWDNNKYAITDELQNQINIEKESLITCNHDLNKLKNQLSDWEVKIANGDEAFLRSEETSILPIKGSIATKTETADDGVYYCKETGGFIAIGVDGFKPFNELNYNMQIGGAAIPDKVYLNGADFLTLKNGELVAINLRGEKGDPGADSNWTENLIPGNPESLGPDWDLTINTSSDLLPGTEYTLSFDFEFNDIEIYDPDWFVLKIFVDIDKIFVAESYNIEAGVESSGRGRYTCHFVTPEDLAEGCDEIYLWFNDFGWSKGAHGSFETSKMKLEVGHNERTFWTPNIQSLVGPMGNKGEQGPQGEKGDPGRNPEYSDNLFSELPDNYKLGDEVLVAFPKNLVPGRVYTLSFDYVFNNIGLSPEGLYLQIENASFYREFFMVDPDNSLQFDDPRSGRGKKIVTFTYPDKAEPADEVYVRINDEVSFLESDSFVNVSHLKLEEGENPSPFWTPNLNSYRGPQGPKGDKGDKGDVGPQGLNGADGAGYTHNLLVNSDSYVSELLNDKNPPKVYPFDGKLYLAGGYTEFTVSVDFLFENLQTDSSSYIKMFVYGTKSNGLIYATEFHFDLQDNTVLNQSGRASFTCKINAAVISQVSFSVVAVSGYAKLTFPKLEYGKNLGSAWTPPIGLLAQCSKIPNLLPTQSFLDAFSHFCGRISDSFPEFAEALSDVISEHISPIAAAANTLELLDDEFSTINIPQQGKIDDMKIDIYTED